MAGFPKLKREGGEGGGSTDPTTSGTDEMNKLYNQMFAKRRDMVEGTLDAKVAKDMMNTVS